MQSRCNLPPLCHWESPRVRWQHLNTNVVGARGLMGANAIDNGGRITPGDDGVYQLITAAIEEVLVSEAETAQVIHVIWQFEIRERMRPRDLSCFGRIGFKYDGLLDGQEFIAAQNLPRTRRVLRRHEI